MNDATEKKFQTISDEALERMSQVKCDVEDYIEGLTILIEDAKTHRTAAEETD